MRRMQHSTRQSKKPRRNGNATKQVAEKLSHNFKPATAICVLWAVTTPAPKRLNQRGFEWSCIVHEPLDGVARELVRLGLLQELPGPRAGDLWIDAYRL